MESLPLPQHKKAPDENIAGAFLGFEWVEMFCMRDN